MEISAASCIRQLGEAKPLGAFRVGEVKLRRLAWVDDDVLLITHSSTAPMPVGFVGRSMGERFLLATYTVSKQLLEDVNVQVRDEPTLNSVWGTSEARDIGGKTALFVRSTYITNRTLPGLFRYSLEERHAVMVAKGSEDTSNWLIDENGRVVAESLYHDAKKQWELMAQQGRSDDPGCIGKCFG